MTVRVVYALPRRFAAAAFVSGVVTYDGPFARGLA